MHTVAEDGGLIRGLQIVEPHKLGCYDCHQLSQDCRLLVNLQRIVMEGMENSLSAWATQDNCGALAKLIPAIDPLADEELLIQFLAFDSNL